MAETEPGGVANAGIAIEVGEVYQPVSETRSKVQIIEHETLKLSRPNVIVGIPEVGLVGNIVGAYLVDQLGLPEVAFVDSSLIPPVILVRDSMPTHPVRVFGRGNLVVILSEIPLTPRLSYELSVELARWSKSKQSRLVVGVTGVPSRSRIEEPEEAKPKVFAVTNDSSLLHSIGIIGAQVYEEGMLVGTYATLLKECMKEDVSNVTFLSEAYLQFPDPGSAAAILEVLNHMLPISVDVKPLLQGTEEIRLKSRELMSQTRHAMQQMAGTTPGIYG